MKTKKNRRSTSLDGINIKELMNWIKKDKTKYASIKCMAMIALSKGMRVCDVCEIWGITRESLRNWRNILKLEGPKGFIEHLQTGRRSKLNIQMKENLKRVLQESPQKLGLKRKKWSGEAIKDYVEIKWNIKITARTGLNWLRNL